MSVFIPIPKKGNVKECSNYSTIALISHASEVMLKILQARLQQYMNVNFLMFKLVLEKAEASCQSRLDARYWMLGAGALGRPRGMEWGGRREEGSGWGTHVYLWRIHFDIWQN